MCVCLCACIRIYVCECMCARVCSGGWGVVITVVCVHAVSVVLQHNKLKFHCIIYSLILQNGTKLSVIAPRCLPFLQSLFEKGLTSVLQPDQKKLLEDADHSLHPSHLVLFQGFELPG